MGLNEGGVKNEQNDANLVVAGFEFVNGLSRRGDKNKLMKKVRDELDAAIKVPKAKRAAGVPDKVVLKGPHRGGGVSEGDR